MEEREFEPGPPNAVEITYRGYRLHFSENDERWRCSALDLDAEKMKTLKTKIDKFVAASRKLAKPLHAIHINYHDEAKPVTIIAFAQPGHRHNNKTGTGEPTHAWCMAPGKERFYNQAKGGYDYRDTTERTKIALKDLFADLPETHAILRELERMDAEIKQLQGRRKTKAEELKLATRVFDIPPPDPEQESDRD